MKKKLTSIASQLLSFHYLQRTSALDYIDVHRKRKARGVLRFI